MTSNLRAVQNRRFITVPFSATTLGVRIGSLAFNLAEAVTAMVNNAPLSSVQFTEISLTEQGTSGATIALGKSGAKVYTRLPIFNGVDLETFCPGGSSKIFVTDDSDQVKPPVADSPAESPPTGAEVQGSMAFQSKSYAWTSVSGIALAIWSLF